MVPRIASRAEVWLLMLMEWRNEVGGICGSVGDACPKEASTLLDRLVVINRSKLRLRR